jgi:5-methylcytosine-specific restriction endonuclease McrA
MQSVLLLNADRRPLRVVPWERALVLVLTDRADLVEAVPDRLVRSPSRAVPWPAVVGLRDYVQAPPRTRFGRRGVFARDGYACQYCGRKGLALELDHVVPRAQSRDGKVVLPWSGRTVPVTCWENVVTSCRDCNSKKADRTPAQAGLTLLTLPRRPTRGDALRLQLGREPIPAEWKPYVS